ncbi:hypothetical protein RDI58_008997 [Solanum bulbocastanum]|uniref:Uncharacterized protein n=1 Tax=Solanum bulbocastanum TaxID=147425 RepID=A0AAN8TW38_SOLBU
MRSPPLPSPQWISSPTIQQIPALTPCSIDPKIRLKFAPGRNLNKSLLNPGHNIANGFWKWLQNSLKRMEKMMMNNFNKFMLMMMATSAQ